MLKNHQLANQTSGEVEFYTPPFIAEAARKVMGHIDLDPASCEKANTIIKANVYYGINHDSLNIHWHGNIFMNHPFHKGENVCNKEKCKRKICKDRGYHCEERIPSNIDWVNKILYEFDSKNTNQACILTYASMGSEWFRPLMKFTQCYFFERVKYLDENLNEKPQPTKGSCLTYLGHNITKFAKVFSEYGEVKVSVKPLLS